MALYKTKDRGWGKSVFAIEKGRVCFKKRACFIFANSLSVPAMILHSDMIKFLCLDIPVVQTGSSSRMFGDTAKRLECTTTFCTKLH